MLLCKHSQIPQQTRKEWVLLQHMLLVKATRETKSKIQTRLVPPDPMGH